jgi:hypothetical protein
MTNSSRVSWVKYLDGLIVILEMGSIGLSSRVDEVLFRGILGAWSKEIMGSGKN